MDIEVTPVEIGAAILIVSFGGYVIISHLWCGRKTRRKIQEKQTQCQHSIKELEKELAENKMTRRRRDAITSMPFAELQAQLQNEELTADDALVAYQMKALEENKRLNCVVEPIWEAIDDASLCSSLAGQEKPPLYGVPISVKENYYLQGYESTGGVSSFLGNPARQDGVLTKVLKHQGAIPFVRTNIPQSMMTFECSNPIYGTTLNPHNLKRGPGGSSGGEGALIGAEGSILGWGTDIGGSLRIPSHACGIYCLKPTRGRISTKTCEELVEGQTLVTSTPGPMARDVDTLVAAMKAVLCPYHFQLDPDVPPIPFNEKVFESQRPLRIGFYNFDGNIRCIPGVERAVEEARLALVNQGHTLVPFKVPRVEHMFAELFATACFGDGGYNFLQQVSDDVIDPSIKLILTSYRLPHFVQRILSYLVNFVAREQLPGKTMRAMLGVKSVREWWKLAVSMSQYREEFLADWKDKKLDAIICPTMPYVAVPTGAVKYLLGGATYTTLYNVLNYPSGCVPVTRVTAIDQAQMKNYPSRTATEKYIKKFFSSDTGGLPVAVQCVGLPYQEELVLRVMKDLENGLKK